MSSLAELPELIGFFSYSREDDEAFKGMLSALRDGIQRELSAQLGRTKRTFRLWQDQVAIAPGKLWESEIKKAVAESVFFIPIVTPRAINSKYCKFEFESFLAREKAIGRNDLVFPILYIAVAALENEAKWRGDPILLTIGQRQYVDWRSLRYSDVHTSAVREQIGRFCQMIVEALNEPWISPEERRRMEEAEARQQAEEEARRLETDAKSRAEEEKNRRQAEAKARAEEEARRLETEAKRRAEEEQHQRQAKAKARRQAEEERKRQEAEAQLRVEQDRAFAAACKDAMASDDPAVLKAFLKTYRNGTVADQVRERLRHLEPQKVWPIRRAAIAAALLLLIGGGYAFLRHTEEKGTQQAELKWEEQRKAAEAEVNRKVAQVEQERLAALKAVEQERQGRAAAEAEVKRINEQAEKMLVALRAEQDRQARAAAEAEAKRKADEAEQQRLAAVKAEQQQRGLFTIRRSIEASGSTVDSFYSLSFEECEQKCSQKPTCNVFTWLIGTRACYLYSHAELKPNASFDSGVRNSVEQIAEIKPSALPVDSSVTTAPKSLFTIRRGMEASLVSGSGVEFKGLSFEDCEQKCTQQPMICSVFTWQRTGGACYLYSRAELKPNANFDSGTRNSVEQIATIKPSAVPVSPSVTTAPKSLFTIRRGMQASSRLFPGDSFQSLSFGECEQKCAQRGAACNIFTYNKRTANGVCYLYTRADLEPNADFDTGVRN